MTNEEIQVLRVHIANMRAKEENLMWDAKVLGTRAETIGVERMRLESIVDRLETPKA